MSTSQSFVIIGNGIAGVTAAEVLRAEDPTCAITIIADDPFPAYYRPALKDFLGGHLPEEKLWARPATFYQQHQIRFIPARVTELYPSQHVIQLHNGKTVRYHTLLLANGARSRTLSCPGLDLGGVSTLRTITDYQEVLRRLEHVQHVVISGSGTLALESAETLRHMGLQVTHLLRGKTLWSEVLDPVASEMVLQEEQRDGVDVRVEEEITQILGKNGQVHGIITTSGEHISCELVLIAVGIEPVTDFIRKSGIVCGRGVKVDSQMRTSEPDIFAAGDVIETTDKLTGRTRILGQWFPAIQQAQKAAYSMLVPSESNPVTNTHPAHAVLYNATFLYGLDFVSIGLTTSSAAPGFQELIAPPKARDYRKAILYNGNIVGALLLGDRSQGMAFKRAIDHRINLTSVADQLFQEGFDLNTWLSEQGVAGPQFNEQHGPALDHPRIQSATLMTSTQTDTRYSLEQLSQETNGYFVPIPHPKVAVSLAETRITFSGRKQVMTIGREKGVTWQIEHRSISRRHAEVAYANGSYWLCDVGSSNGTFINGMLQSRSKPHQLRPGDYIRLGDIQFRFELHPRTSQETTHKPLPLTATKSDAARSLDKQKPVAGLEHRKDVAPLLKEHLQFEISMCIGCDRCMAVCPVPTSSQVTIAALNQATLTKDVTPVVTRFTHECVMCGSCVPVCPVDNHRDLLMLSLKQRLGTSWEIRPDIEQAATNIPPGWTLLQLAQRLREQAFLREPGQVPDNYLLHMIAISRLHTLEAGAEILREGEYGRDLYLILEGQVKLSATNRENTELPVAIVQRGEFLGEDGMLTGLPYKFSAQARGPALLLQVPEQAVQRLMELVPGVHQYFERATQERSLYTIFTRIKLFENVADADIQNLTSVLQVKHYERNERLFTDDAGGRPAREAVHILLEGFVKVARHIPDSTGQGSERIIAYRQGGDYFVGGLDLLGDGQAVTVTTINRCRVVEVPSRAIMDLFQRYPKMKRYFEQRLKEYIETSTSMQSGRAPQAGQLLASSTPSTNHVAQEGLHAVVNNGVVEGTEVLVIDLDKCIHCNECEYACERRHGHSRMNRKGIVVGNISVVTACRQCQDPVCLLCSRAGIARHPNGEVYITESCIGCGICAERCPYGAISIAQIDDDAPEHNSWQRFSKWFSKNMNTERARKTLPMVHSSVAGGSRVAPAPFDILSSYSGYDELRKKIAIKCDLCAGYSDQACVQACPAGAAFRVKPTRFFGSTEEILQRQK